MTMSSNGVSRFQCETPLLQLGLALTVPSPSDLSAAVRIEVYASFEFQPMLGAGEQLRKLATTVEQLLDRSEKDFREWDDALDKGLGIHSMAAFTLFPKNDDVVSPCSSILVTVKRRKCAGSDSSGFRVLGPHCVSRRLVSAPSSLISVYP